MSKTTVAHKERVKNMLTKEYKEQAIKNLMKLSEGTFIKVLGQAGCLPDNTEQYTITYNDYYKAWDAIVKRDGKEYLMCMNSDEGYVNELNTYLMHDHKLPDIIGSSESVFTRKGIIISKESMIELIHIFLRHGEEK